MKKYISSPGKPSANRGQLSSKQNSIKSLKTNRIDVK